MKHDAAGRDGVERAGVFRLHRPITQTLPLVVASPHSGSVYPPEFLAQSALEPMALRRSEDAFVDRIFAGTPDLGAPLLTALFPRAMLDVNREAWELDPAMFADSLPGWVNSRSPRVAVGLGTIARIVASGANIYRRKLTFLEARQRIDRYWRPYHEMLGGTVQGTYHRFGWSVLLDAHSMPPLGERDGGAGIDIVLGDCFGSSCAALVTHTAERLLQSFGLRVVRNDPYAGGYVTRHYGRPRDGIHALQIEINRALYMDEARFELLPQVAELTARLTQLVQALGALRLPAVAPRILPRAAE